MSTKVLRPVPTFEQVIRIPEPVINLPDRVPEVSRPDPNLWDEHDDAVRARSVMVTQLRVHDHESRDAAHATGVPIDAIRSVMRSAQSMAHSDAMIDEADGVIQVEGRMPPGGYGPRDQERLFGGIREMFGDMRAHSERTARAGQDAVIERLMPEIQEAQRRSEFAARLAEQHRPMQDEVVGTLGAMQRAMGGVMQRTEDLARAHEARMQRGETSQAQLEQMIGDHHSRLAEMMSGDRNATREQVEGAVARMAGESASQRDGTAMNILAQGDRFASALSGIRPAVPEAPEAAQSIDVPSFATPVFGKAKPYSPSGFPGLFPGPPPGEPPAGVSPFQPPLPKRGLFPASPPPRTPPRSDIPRSAYAEFRPPRMTPLGLVPTFPWPAPPGAEAPLALPDMPPPLNAPLLLGPELSGTPFVPDIPPVATRTVQPIRPSFLTSVASSPHAAASLFARMQDEPKTPPFKAGPPPGGPRTPPFKPAGPPPGGLKTPPPKPPPFKGPPPAPPGGGIEDPPFKAPPFKGPPGNSRRSGR